MIDPWRHVDAESDLAADLLAGTVEMVLELGGWIHPEARFVEAGGQLSVTCPVTDGELLLRLPRGAFVPIGRVGWSPADDRLGFDDAAEALSGAEHELLILQTTLHNVCGKVPWISAAHPVLARDLSSATVDAVRAFRPSFRLGQPTAASLFWSNRAFRLPVDGADAEPLALPLVDLLNHDQRGATGTWDGGDFTVPVAHPTGTDECLLDYGLQRDAIGMAVVYGFADRSSQVAHSAPLDVALPHVGRVRIAAKGRSRSADLLPPVVLDVHEGLTTLSHLTFRPGEGGRLVDAVSHATGWSSAASAEVVTLVADANAGLAEHLIQTASADPVSAAATTLAQAAVRYASVLSAAAVGTPVTESSSSSDSSGITGSD